MAVQDLEFWEKCSNFALFFNIQSTDIWNCKYEEILISSADIQ